MSGGAGRRPLLLLTLMCGQGFRVRHLLASLPPLLGSKGPWQPLLWPSEFFRVALVPDSRGKPPQARVKHGHRFPLPKIRGPNKTRKSFRASSPWQKCARAKMGTAIRFSFAEPLYFQHQSRVKIGGCTLFSPHYCSRQEYLPCEPRGGSGCHITHFENLRLAHPDEWNRAIK